MRFIEIVQLYYRLVLGVFGYTFVLVEHIARTGTMPSMGWVIAGAVLVSAAVMPWSQDRPGGTAC